MYVSCMYVHVTTCMYVCTCICMYDCMYVCIYIYVLCMLCLSHTFVDTLCFYL